MMKDEAGRDNSKITSDLQQYLADASTNAENLFTTVLRSKDRADSIRNTLRVLQRFRFLFHLPLSIERNIAKGDYGVVINDYIKARSLFADTEVPVFKRVYDEVANRMQAFHANLLDELNQLPLPLSRQKTLIRFLLELRDGNNDGDPAWNCLDNQHRWIQDQMNKCKDKYLKMAKEIVANTAAKTSNVPQLFLAELASLAMTQIPEHWHLWEDYSTGVILSETGEKSKDVEKLKAMASKHGKQMKNLLRDTVSLVECIGLTGSLFYHGVFTVRHIPNGNLDQYNGTNALRYLSSTFQMIITRARPISDFLCNTDITYY